MARFIQFCILLFAFLSGTHSQNSWIPFLLPPDYDRFLTPTNSIAPLNVNATLRINSFGVNERSQILTTDVILCLRWQDYRLLDIPRDEVKLTDVSRFWIPLVYFRNSLSSNAISTLNRFEYLQVFSRNKTLNYCRRLTVDFICVFQLPNFPFDEHYCRLELENYDLARQDIRLTMQNVPGVRGNTRFRLRNTYEGNCDPIPDEYGTRRLKTWSDQFEVENCAYITLRLVRTINYYIIRYYAPTFFMVLVSFTQFWMPTNAWPARIILTATIMMTLITISLNGYNEVPSNDVTALYWWFWCCQLFIYAGLVAYALALAWTYLIQDKKSAKAGNKPVPVGHYFGNAHWFAAVGPSFDRFIRFFFGPIDHYRDPVHRNKVDYFCRIIFPTALIFYSLLYIVSTIPVWTPKFYW